MLDERWIIALIGRRGESILHRFLCESCLLSLRKSQAYNDTKVKIRMESATWGGKPSPDICELCGRRGLVEYHKISYRVEE